MTDCVEFILFFSAALFTELTARCLLFDKTNNTAIRLNLIFFLIFSIFYPIPRLNVSLNK